MGYHTHGVEIHKPSGPTDEHVESGCPQCGAKSDIRSGYCPSCGALFGTGHYGETQQKTTSFPPEAGEPAPIQSEHYVVRQQLPGVRDVKLEYTCPRCTAKIDPKSGICPNCGYIGSMQYEISQPKTIPPVFTAEKITPLKSQGFTGRQYQRPSEPSQKQTCPSCGASISIDSRICPMCGARCGSGRPRMQKQLISIAERERGSSPPAISSLPSAVSFAAAARADVARVPSIPLPERALPREKKREKKEKVEKIKKVKEPGYPEEKRGFPLGLLLAVIIVAVGLVGMVVYVVSQEFTSPVSGPSPSPPSTGVVDKTPPIISGLSYSDVSGSNVTISWVTDEKASSRVEYCDPDGVCGWGEEKSLVKNHSIAISDIKLDIPYHITVKSVDANGNEAITEADRTFKTAVTADIDPPLISDTTVTDITESSTTITWKTNEEATSQIKYGPTSSYGTTTALDSNLTMTHSMELINLNPNTTYHFRVLSKDASNNERVSDVDQTFTTLAPVPVGYEVGNRAPDFTLENLDGESVTLSDFRGKIVMVNFWATWCAPCVAEMPYIQAISTDWSGDRELAIFAINVKESAAVAQSFIDSKGYTFPVLLDVSGDVKTNYNASTIPRTFFVDTEGIIQNVQVGRFQSQSEIESILDSL